MTGVGYMTNARMTPEACEMLSTHWYVVILCIALAILALGLTIILALYYVNNKRHQKELLELGRYSSNIQAVIDSSIPQILETIINDAFQDYQIMDLIPRQELYITTEREKEIRSALVEKVVTRISPMALDKISLFYNVHQIDEIIADKVYITVMNYVVTHNSVITDNKETK